VGCKNFEFQCLFLSSRRLFIIATAFLVFFAFSPLYQSVVFPFLPAGILAFATYLFRVRFLVNNLKRQLFKILTMRLSDFIVLNVDEKKATVLHQGVLIAKRSSLDSMVFLFQLGNYYVEAYCNPSNKAIEEYRMFDNIEVLKPYLEAIPLDNLLN
jgi:hypothetical protein